MFRLSIRQLLAKKLRLLTTAVAIVLGVSFTAGTMMLADTMTASFSSTVDDISDGVDTVVRGHRIAAAEWVTPRSPVALADLAKVRAVDGVAAAAPYWEGYAQPIGSDGKALDTQQAVGLNWIDDDDLSMFEIVDGRAPRTTGEIVLGADTASDAGMTVGDDVDVITRSGRATFTVTGLSRLDGGASLGNTAFTFFHDDDAATHLSEPGTTHEILVRGDDSTDEATLSASIATAVAGYDVVTGSDQAAEQKSDLGDAIGTFETILLVFGGIALFVGSFTIANTFTITVAQRTKELALVRAIGASRRQVLGSVVIEATVLGTIAAAVGLVGGFGVAKVLTSLFATIGLEFPERALVVAPSTVAVAFAAGVLVTVGAALVPARRAARVAPVDAIRDASIEQTVSSRRRVVVGTMFAGLGAAGVGVGVAQGSAALVGIGSLAAFHASIALGPVLVRPITAVTAVPMRRMGTSGRLAAANATRNPKRSAATAAALTIGVTLVAGASMFASTARATILGDTSDIISADRVIQPIGVIPGIPTDVAATVDTIEGTTSAPMQTVPIRIGDDVTDLAGLDLAAASAHDLVDFSVVDGEITAAADRIVVGDQIAADQGWNVGDTIEMTFVDRASLTVTVEAIIDQTMAIPPMIAAYDTVAAHGVGLDHLVLVSGSSATLTTVDSTLATVPTATSATIDEYAASLAGSLDTLLTLVIGFLGLAVVIAVLGIATTIGLSVHERTAEFGVLRAVGMSRRQLKRSIRLESIVVAVFGTVLGLAMGVGFTWAALTTLDDDGFVAPVVPTQTLVLITAGALIAGTVAAALPARRAARKPVLDAIHAD